MDPALITAWATVANAGSTMLVGGAACFLTWRGIGEMHRHEEAQAIDIRRHEEAMATLRALHSESMTALRTLFERTGPAVPAE